MPRKTTFLNKPIKKGALHKQLGIPMSKRIPLGLEREIMEARIGNKVRGHTVTALLKRRVGFALNIGRKRSR
jgi:hypothetical protein